MKKTTFSRVSVCLLMLGSIAFASSVIKTNAAFVDGVPAKYSTDFDSFDQEKAAANEFNIQLAAESFVLMKNENGALPLTSSEKLVSLFGTRSDNIILGGAGSGSGSTAGAKSVQESLEAVGLTLNPSLLRLYAATTATTELVITALDGVKGSYDMYNDAAIIMLSRTGSEFNDAALYRVAGHSNPLDHYYSLDDNEIDLVNMVGNQFEKVIVVINSAHPIEMGWLEDHEGVDAILWIGHTGTTGIMALGKTLIGEVNPSGKLSDIYAASFAMDPTWPNFKGNIQSQLIRGVGVDSNNVYTHYEGEGSPNNILAPLNGNTDGIASNDWDYYSYSRATDSEGRTISVDGPSKGARYYAALDYEEGIYMGYRWYETAAAEGYFNNDNRFTVVDRALATPEKYDEDLYFNRLDGVVYPFGYGLSYTNFDVSIEKVIHNGAKFVSGDSLNTSYGKDITLYVKVKNTGPFAGKQVLQAYFSAPYIPGEIEKSSVTFIEFEKTKLLQPGQSQLIPITFKVQYMSSFDYNDANGNGHAGYELDPGTYDIGIYNSSHEKFDSIEAEVDSVVNYDKDPDNGNDVSVKFTGDGVWDGTRSDLDYYDTRRTELVSETPMTYLSRTDLHGTFPEAPKASDLKWKDDAILILSSQVYYTSFNDLPTDPWYKTADDVVGWDQAADTSGRVNGKTATQLYELSGVPFDDARWDAFLNQLTFVEMKSLIQSNSFRTPALDSIGKPASNDRDGPAQISGGTFWVCEVNIASTFNKEMAYKQGLFVGNESLYAGTQGWYGPGLNIHRNPAAGRNFEYYSQDGVHSGLIAAQVIRGATDKGVTVYMKHLLANDQETSRYTASTFMTEQALREIYARPWEYAIKFGKATASMSAFNKVGLLSTTANDNLYNGLLRDEFGFRYSSVTDMFGWGYSPGSSGDMAARTNITPLGSWNNTFGRNIEGEWDPVAKNVKITFTGNVTNGTLWTKDDATGTATSALNATTGAVSINKINSRDFADYATTGVKVDYANSTKAGPSAAYKDATNMKDGTVLYEVGDVEHSYTQWSAVRTAAKSVLFAQVNSNTMKNNVNVSGLVGKTLSATQGTAIAGTGLDVTYPVSGAVYKLAGNSVLPGGLTLTAAGRVTGTPTQAGSFTFSVSVVVDGYISANVNHTITIASNWSALGMDNLGIGVPVNTAVASADYYVGRVFGSGWNRYTVTDINISLVSGNLPDGLVLGADGSITGVPTKAGSGSFSVIAKVTTTNASQYFEFISPVAYVVNDVDPALFANVAFNGNYVGSSPVEVSLLKGGKVNAAVAPYRPGFIFTGWFKDAEGAVAADFSVEINEDVVFYAGWVAINASQEALDAALIQVNASIDALSVLITGNATDIAAIQTAVGLLNQSITELTASINSLGTVDSQTATKINTINESIAALNTLLDEVNADITSINGSIGQINSDLDDVNTKLDEEPAGCGGSLTASLITSVALLGVATFFAIKRKKED